MCVCVCLDTRHTQQKTLTIFDRVLSPGEVEQLGGLWCRGPAGFLLERLDNLFRPACWAWSKDTVQLIVPHKLFLLFRRGATFPDGITDPKVLQSQFFHLDATLFYGTVESQCRHLLAKQFKNLPVLVGRRKQLRHSLVRPYTNKRLYLFGAPRLPTKHFPPFFTLICLLWFALFAFYTPELAEPYVTSSFRFGWPLWWSVPLLSSFFSLSIKLTN